MNAPTALTSRLGLHHATLAPEVRRRCRRQLQHRDGGSLFWGHNTTIHVAAAVGDPLHLLLRQAVHLHHVPAHVAGHGERLLTEGTRRLTGVLLHVLHQAPAVGVGGPAHRADARTAHWKQSQNMPGE